MAEVPCLGTRSHSLKSLFMANKLILNNQIFNISELICELPNGKFRKKIFFQSELRNLVNGDATFGVIAYPAWKETGKRWQVGKKISGRNTGNPTVIDFNPPLAFANNELLLAVPFSLKNRKKTKKLGLDKKMIRLLEMVRKITRDKEVAKKSFFSFETTISDNPHLEYNVTLESEGSSYSTRTNPSPPAKPVD